MKVYRHTQYMPIQNFTYKSHSNHKLGISVCNPEIPVEEKIFYHLRNFNEILQATNFHKSKHPSIYKKFTKITRNIIEISQHRPEQYAGTSSMYKSTDT